MSITKITTEKIAQIEKKTVKTLPNDPSKQGYSPDQIKRRMYAALLDSDNSLVAEVNRIVTEINEALQEISQGHDVMQVSVEEPTDPNVRYWFRVVSDIPDIITNILSGGTFDEVPIDILLGGTFDEVPADSILGGTY